MRALLRTSLAALATLAAVGCQDLELKNPNAPDATRALTNATAIEAIAGGTIRTFFNTYHGLDATGPLSTMAQSHTASWNNFNMNFYSSLDADGTRGTRGWQNDPALSGRTSVEWFWQGYYSAASSARDVLVAIRINNLAFDSTAAQRRAEAVAELMLGAALGQIALNYDKGYYLDENTNLLALQYIDRKALRDSAVKKLRNAATLANATAFNLPNGWTNGGGSYTNITVARLANTLAAMTLAYWPRDNGENAAINWALVDTLAAAGITDDFVIVGDGCDAFCPEMHSWTNDIFGIRVHTRVSNLLDPATQANPYPTDGNPQPNSTDARLGDGSFGPAATDNSDFPGDYGTVPKTANAGTDFAWSAYEAFFPSRGQYHQSNLTHIRYDLSGTQSPTSIYYGFGPVPLVMAAQNDLIRAEAIIRRGGALSTAAALINGTRVGRGNLSPATAGDGAAVLNQYLNYENEIELLSQGASVYYNRRRSVTGLLAGTPLEMPVPAKELGVKVEALYSFGGANPLKSPTPP